MFVFMVEKSSFVSTRNYTEKVNSSTAILQGIASDGGLFMPEIMPTLDYKKMLAMNFQQLAQTILKAFFTDFTDVEIQDCVKGAYNKDTFDVEDVVELKQITDNKYVLELWHGRTCAFKDIALSILPYLMTKSIKKAQKQEKIVILTATSGDTGSAALCGFGDVKGVEIIVFYPLKGISNIQKMQMTTNASKNVKVCAIDGNFDQAQQGVKYIFNNISKDFCKNHNVLLSSANSINIGRLIPQIIYYFSTYNSLVKNNKIKVGDFINFVVPTGNFGDIFAGYLAKYMGLPIKKLVCASNKNNVLTDFFKTGIYDANRPFFQTFAPAMDILVSSNLERLLYLISNRDCEFVSECMSSLSNGKTYKIPFQYLQQIQEVFDYNYVDDDNILQTIEQVYKSHNYILDPHTAVAWKSAEYCCKNYTEPCIVLSTASPYKFPDVVEKSIGCKLDENNIPNTLKNILSKKEIHKDCIFPNQMMEYVLKNI